MQTKKVTMSWNEFKEMEKASKLVEKLKDDLDKLRQGRFGIIPWFKGGYVEYPPEDYAMYFYCKEEILLSLKESIDEFEKEVLRLKREIADLKAKQRKKYWLIKKPY